MIALPSPPPRRVPVVDDASIYGVRQEVRQMAAALGFDTRAIAELVLIASELTSNVRKHAGRGELEVRVVEGDKRGPGLDVIARDQGPPIVDFQAALQDGWSGGGQIDPARLFGRKGIGAGLGAVQRLSDELRYREVGDGKEIQARRFVVRPRAAR